VIWRFVGDLERDLERAMDRDFDRDFERDLVLDLDSFVDSDLERTFDRTFDHNAFGRDSDCDSDCDLQVELPVATCFLGDRPLVIFRGDCDRERDFDRDRDFRLGGDFLGLVDSLGLRVDAFSSILPNRTLNRELINSIFLSRRSIRSKVLNNRAFSTRPCSLSVFIFSCRWHLNLSSRLLIFFS